MPACVLQLDFELTVPPAEYERSVASLAPAFAEIRGLVWKLWLLNPDARQAGGIYLFEDEKARQNFLQSDLAAQVKAAPFLRDLTARPFEAMEGVSRVTRAPLVLPTPVIP